MINIIMTITINNKENNDIRVIWSGWVSKVVPVRIKDPFLGEFNAMNVLAKGKPLKTQNGLFPGKELSVYLARPLPEMIRLFDRIDIIQHGHATQLLNSNFPASLPYTLIPHQGSSIIFI